MPDTSNPGKVLLVPPLPPQLVGTLTASYDVIALPGQDRDAFLSSHAADLAEVTAVVATNFAMVDASLIAALPRLEVITNHGVGYDNIDLAAANSRGIAVSNTPGVLDAAVTETAVGLLLATRRRLVEADRFVRDGRWVTEQFPLTGQLSGSTVGILGLGRIGRRIADVLTALGCEVSYHSRRPVADVPYTHFASPVALAAAVDNLVVIVPGGPATVDLVDAEVIDALGPGGVLVNVARGPVVDEDALVGALREGRLGAAGLDVFRDEPHVPDALIALDNVVLLPHIGSATEPTRAAMRQLTLDNLASWRAGEGLLTPVPTSR